MHTHRAPVQVRAGCQSRLLTEWELLKRLVWWLAGAILSCGKDHTLKLVDARSFQVRREMRAPGFAVGNVWCSAAISADENYITAGSTDGTVFVWEVSISRAISHGSFVTRVSTKADTHT